MNAGYFRNQATGGGKRQRTRAALLDATVRLVASKGMEALKISDITDAAELANGTFYNHFTDKDEVLIEAAYGIAAEISRQLDADMTGIDDAPSRVVTATRNFISIVLQKPDWAALILGGARHLPHLGEDASQYLRSDLERGVAQGKFDVTVTNYLMSQILALITVAITMQLNKGTDTAMTDQICENILRLLGLTPAKARRVVEAMR
ncbi:MAG: TetR/AcrR family transcriptional regulator [Parvibaculum sp.]|nr:TetR/AcrR family transcriptional regulator [Parvibaculum sp.]